MRKNISWVLLLLPLLCLGSISCSKDDSSNSQNSEGTETTLPDPEGTKETYLTDKNIDLEGCNIEWRSPNNLVNVTLTPSVTYITDIGEKNGLAEVAQSAIPPYGSGSRNVACKPGHGYILECAHGALIYYCALYVVRNIENQYGVIIGAEIKYCSLGNSSGSGAIITPSGGSGALVGNGKSFNFNNGYFYAQTGQDGKTDFILEFCNFDLQESTDMLPDEIQILSILFSANFSTTTVPNGKFMPFSAFILSTGKEGFANQLYDINYSSHNNTKPVKISRSGENYTISFDYIDFMDDISELRFGGAFTYTGKLVDMSPFMQTNSRLCEIRF